MTETADTPPPGDDIDLLLPWYAVERLDPAERARIADALGRDPDLARRLSLAEEERLATQDIHDALPAPSARVRQDLFARIDAMEGGGRRAETGFLDRVLAFVESLSPRTTALAAGLAALLILVQAGFLAGTLVQRSSSYETASYGGSPADGGSYALVTFAPGATTAQMAEALEAEGARIVEGPLPGGMFRVRLSETRLEGRALDDAVAKLTRWQHVIQLVLVDAGR